MFSRILNLHDLFFYEIGRLIRLVIESHLATKIDAHMIVIFSKKEKIGKIVQIENWLKKKCHSSQKRKLQIENSGFIKTCMGTYQDKMNP